MVCPYCSTDMEPIELSGKTFCSNCGLTIGAASPYVPAADITPFSKTDKPDAPIITDVTPPPVPTAPQTPIKDIIKEDFGLPVNEPNDLIFSPPPVVTDASPTETETTSMVEEVTESETEAPIYDTTPAPVSETLAGAPITDTDRTYTIPVIESDMVPNESVSTGEEESSPLEDQDTELTLAGTTEASPNDDEVPPLNRSVTVPDEADFENQPLDEPTENTVEIDNKVQEIDTLGASGILLDILNENYKVEKDEEAIKALEAAEELVGKVSLETPPESSHTDILDHKPENPVEYPEITSPLDELEISPPEEDGVGASEEQVSAHATEKVDSVPEAPGKETHSDPDLYKLPHELPELPESEEEIEKAVEKVEKKLKKLEDPKVTPEAIDSEEYDPDTIDNAYSSIQDSHSGPTPTSVEATQAIAEEPVKPIAVSDTKQSAVTSFFKEKIEGPIEKKKLFGFGKVKKRKSDKKVPTKKTPLWLVLAIAIPLAIFLLLVVTFTFIYYSKPEAQQTRTVDVAKASNFASLTPGTIPDGYQMVSSNYDPESKSLTIKYSFATSENKMIIYTQREVVDTDLSLKEYIKSKDGETYLTKDEGGITFTEFSKGLLAWTKDGFLFTIETEGYDFARDQLYKMALSLG